MHAGVRDASGRYTRTFDILVKLPTGSLTPLNVHHDMTVGELKSVIEFSSGIPSDLVVLIFGMRGVLTDGMTLGELCFIPGTRLPVKILYGYEKIVNCALSGDAKGVMADVDLHHDTNTVAKRRSVALFMAAHRGYHYLVDKLLEAGAVVDARTPSGRTALHIACGMGNLGCVDSLLQHNAALNIQDHRGNTPSQVAFSCGQQDAERRITLYQRVRSQRRRKQTDVMNQSWPRSSRFPTSKLAQSVSPTLALHDLMISPGPTLKITPWKCKTAGSRPPWELSHAVSATPLSSDSSSSSSASSHSGSEVNVAVQSDEESKQYSDEDLNISAQPLHTTILGHFSCTDWVPDRNFGSFCPMRLAMHNRRTHGSNQVLELTVVSERSQLKPSPREAAPPPHIRFSPDLVSTLPVATSEGLQGNGFGNKDYTVRGMMSAYTLRNTGNGKPTSILKHPIRPTSAANSDSALLYRNRQKHTKQYPNARGVVKPPMFELTPSELCNVSPADENADGGEYGIVADDIKLPPKVRDEVDRMRALVDLPVEYPPEEFGVAKIFGNQKQRAGSARRRATPEENQVAYKKWLASKSQDARDRRLVNKVGNMLDKAFGRVPDQHLIPAVPVEKPEESMDRLGTQFEEWTGRKNEERRKAKFKQEQEQDRIERLQREKHEADMKERVAAIDKWVNHKLEIERQNHLKEKQQTRKRENIKSEREVRAQNAFQSWCMRKEWEEIEKLEKRPHTAKASRRTPQQRSQNLNRRRSTGQAPVSRIRSHSMPNPRS